MSSIEQQRSFWNGWNAEWRSGELDEFMSRQRDVAVEWAGKLGRNDLRILDVGCGTGWLGASLRSLGRVTGTDLSSAAIADGMARYPGVDLRAGDFLSLALDGPFDIIVTADCIAHVADQPAFIGRCADLLCPEGLLILMTQNPPIWNRKSALKPAAEGQLRDWPPLQRIRSMLRERFRIEHVGSIVPGGDRGALFWVENRWLRGGMRRLVGRKRWDGLLEKSMLGRELVVVARKVGGSAG